MTVRTEFLLQLLQKLGAPLMAAINAHASADETGEKDAQTMAALLSESVKISVALSQVMNLKPSDGDPDSIRVSLAAMAAGLVADSYRQTGRVPSDNDARRMSKALESVIVFSDNFAPAAEHAQRLQTLEGSPPFIDSVQAGLYSIHALTPAIAAIAEFSFGQAEARLVQDVADRLGAKSKELLGGMPASANAMGEMVVLQALGQIYAAVHRAETARLKEKGDEAAATMDSIWAAFDRQVAMLGVLLARLGGETVSGGASGGGVKPSAALPVSPQESAPPAAPPVAEQPPSAPPAGGGNPMSFFKKKEG